MSPYGSSIRTTKTKRIPKRKPEGRPATSNDFKLLNLILCVGLHIPISTRKLHNTNWHN